MDFTLYGIPTCDTCRRAQKWFTTHKIAYTWVNTREVPPTKSQIETWVKTIGSKAMKNTSGKSYRALPADKNTWTDAQWVEAFTNDPMLLKRPLITKGDQAIGTGLKGTDAEIKTRLGI